MLGLKIELPECIWMEWDQAQMDQIYANGVTVEVQINNGRYSKSLFFWYCFWLKKAIRFKTGGFYSIIIFNIPQNRVHDS
jgi:hypothetical protein